MTDFPYHKQETIWTCGASAMRMALEKCGIKKSEKQVVKILKTNKIRGTWHKDFPRVAEKYKLNYVVKRNATIDDLKYFQKKGCTIIICYYYPPEKVDHYSILKSIDSENIHFYDVSSTVGMVVIGVLYFLSLCNLLNISEKFPKLVIF